jgi:hypothetical protein
MANHPMEDLARFDPFFYSQFCDVAKVPNHPYGDLAKFDYKLNMKVKI